MTVGGIILLIIAVICFFVSRSSSKSLADMNATDTYTSQMLTDLHQRVVSSLGGDALAERCEIEGRIESDAPLKAPLTGTECVAYTLTVNREYEETVVNTDSQGNKTSNVSKGSETVENNERRADFYVRDATGRVLVRPDKATFDWKQTHEQFQPAAVAGTVLQFGDMKLTVPTIQGPRRTLGYKAVEKVVETGINVYILGCASDFNGQAAIGMDKRNDGRFVISRKTERELASSAASSAKKWLYASGGFGVIGAILLVLGMLK